MSLMATRARAQAVAAGRAQPLAAVRHRRLSERPLVVVPLTTAGEVGAPLAALVGTSPDEPRLLAVPQPRDRMLRAAFLAEFAAVGLPYVQGYEDAVEAEPGTETDPGTGKRTAVEREVCANAPQLIVPGRAAVEYVRLLGRSMRFRRTAQEDPAQPYPAPAQVPLFGRWLTHYGERARTPGSSLLLAVTDLLARHWATGQSALEDEHLGALLAWIDPPEGMSGAVAAERAELARDERGLLLHPPAGPATDPAFDNTLLAPAVARFDAARSAQDAKAAARAEAEIRELLAGQLEPVWRDVWRGIGLLRALPEGGRVEERWKQDRWSFTAQRDRIRAGEPPQPRRDDAVTAARKLAARELAQVRLAAQEALDDPLVMAERRLAGEAFAGRVTAVAMACSEGKVPRPRPLVTLDTGDRPALEADVPVYRAASGGRTQEARVVAGSAPGELVLRLLTGMGRGKVPDAGSVPEVGELLVWTLFEHSARGGPGLPPAEATPWTHGGPPTASAPEPHDPATGEDYL